jgi:signal transduction histidine kinase/CheY-like chemotaxis protein
MRKTSLLFRKYVRILMICMGGLALLVGLVHMIIIANAQRHGVATLLDAEGRVASRHIQGFLDRTLASLQWIDDVDQPGVPLDRELVQEAGYEILRREPSIIDFAFFNGSGCEGLSVSRLEPDMRMDCDGAPPADDPKTSLFPRTRAEGVAYGDVFFPDGSEPHVYIGVASRGRNTGALVAEINLKVIHDTVAAIRVGKSGLGFIVDKNNRLIAHPDETFVLKQSKLAHDFADGGFGSNLSVDTDFAGRRVVMASQWIDRLSWRVVVEQPISEAFAPVYAALWSTGALVVVAILGSLVAGLIIADRLARPLSVLRDGVARIARGDLSTRLAVNTGDEIEQVADEFNRMAGALDESRSHLETKVADRTAALQATTQTVQRQAEELTQLNSALSESLDDAQRRKEDAERANAAKTRFLAVASHDLRQPMHAVSLLVGLLSERIHYPEVSELVGKIQGSVEAMEGLFDSLLDISKLDAGAVRPNWEEFPIDTFLDRVNRSFAPIARQKGLELLVQPSAAIIRSDQGLLERIIGNLVSNAIRYTPAGHVGLHCEMSGECLVIVVEDTGIGIPSQYQDRIFDEFFQIASPTRDRSKGLGLGLSIVKRSADLLGHRLSLQSAPTGSRFQIEVPCLGVTNDQEPISSSAREVSKRLSSAFVIVIDDDDDSRFAAEAIYRLWGCWVLALASVEQAFTALKQHLRSPDLIVSDFQLGEGWNGIRAVEELRFRAECLIPAIILTGDVSALQIIHLDASFAVLQKPAGSERLKEVSERLLYLDIPDPASESAKESSSDSSVSEAKT